MTLIIAEAGVNHNRSLDTAFSLVDAAKSAGADYVKFQAAVPAEVVTDSAPMAAYQVSNLGYCKSQLEMTKELHLPLEDFQRIRDYCIRQSIGFFATGFGSESIAYLAGMDLPINKIPSGEITNIPVLRQIGVQQKPVILSTGMANLSEIENAIDVLVFAGTSREQITLLHCTTEYPAPVDEVNLRAMNTMSHAFGLAVGYSDHTDGIAVPIAAVALGATVIEKHLTLDRRMEGPDHMASLEPHQFSAMVQGIRVVEHALGDGIKRPTISERLNLPIVRKSIVASRAILAGESFTPDNLTTKRPGTGISPIKWDDLIGRIATRAYAPDQLIEW